MIDYDTYWQAQQPKQPDTDTQPQKPLKSPENELLTDKARE